VEYSLTPVGQSLLPIIEPIVEWGRQYLVCDVDFTTNEA
jgi:DNA-binding HxlR family transcriptional regulator